MRLALFVLCADWYSRVGVQISAEEFCKYFEAVLPQNAHDFDVLMVEFRQVARICQESTSKRRHRLLKLMQVFVVLDLDGSGLLEPKELFEMGKQMYKAKGDWCTHRIEWQVSWCSSDRVIETASLHALTESSCTATASSCALTESSCALTESSCTVAASSCALTASSCAAGEWTESHNRKLLKQLDSDGDSNVSASEFCKYFELQLPTSTAEFDTAITEFAQVAASCRALRSRMKARLMQLMEVRSPCCSHH